VEAILKRCGSPLVVASRYRPLQYLIGPTLFPVYKFVLGVVLIGCLVPRFLIWLGFLLLDPAHRGYLHMENMWGTVLFFTFFTTLAFVIVERSGFKLEALDYLNPCQLPPVRDPNRISRSGPLFEIGAAVVVNLWFVTMFWPRPAFEFFGAQITPAPLWQRFFWGFLLLAAANVTLAGVNLFCPYWTTRRASLRLVFDGLGASLFCLLLKAQVIAGISAPNLPASKAIELTNVINLVMARMLPWAIVTMVVILCFDAYRIMRIRRVHPYGGSAGPAVKKLSNPVVNGN
jgi:hypothetical protein